MLRDRGFAMDLRRRLERLIEEHCKAMEPGGARNSGLWRLVPSFAVFHVLRRFPKWATWLPTHQPRLQTVGLRPDEGERSPGARASPDEAGPPADEGEAREQHALH